MAQIEIGYDVIGTHYYTVETDDYLDEDSPKKWEDMTDEEKEDFVREVGMDVSREAEHDCDYGLGPVCSYYDENGKSHNVQF